MRLNGTISLSTNFRYPFHELQCVKSVLNRSPPRTDAQAYNLKEDRACADLSWPELPQYRKVCLDVYEFLSFDLAIPLIPVTVERRLEASPRPELVSLANEHQGKEVSVL